MTKQKKRFTWGLAMFCTMTLASGAVWAAEDVLQSVPPVTRDNAQYLKDYQKFEVKYQVALGLAVRDETGKLLMEWRSRETVPMGSTIAAMQCARVYDLGIEDRQHNIDEIDVTSGSIVSADWKGEISLSQACRAAVQWGDARAINFIYRYTSGPEALTEWMVRMGDTVTEANRLAPDFYQVGHQPIQDKTVPSQITLLWHHVDQAMDKDARGRWWSDLESSGMGDAAMPQGLSRDWKVLEVASGFSNPTSDYRVQSAIIIAPSGARYYAMISLKGVTKEPVGVRDRAIAEMSQLMATVLEKEEEKKADD